MLALLLSILQEQCCKLYISSPWYCFWIFLGLCYSFLSVLMLLICQQERHPGYTKYLYGVTHT